MSPNTGKRILADRSYSETLMSMSICSDADGDITLMNSERLEPRIESRHGTSTVGKANTRKGSSLSIDSRQWSSVTNKNAKHVVSAGSSVKFRTPPNERHSAPIRPRERNIPSEKVIADKNVRIPRQQVSFSASTTKDRKKSQPATILKPGNQSPIILKNSKTKQRISFSANEIARGKKKPKNLRTSISASFTKSASNQRSQQINPNETKSRETSSKVNASKSRNGNVSGKSTTLNPKLPKSTEPKSREPSSKSNASNSRQGNSKPITTRDEQSANQSRKSPALNPRLPKSTGPKSREQSSKSADSNSRQGSSISYDSVSSSEIRDWYKKEGQRLHLRRTSGQFDSEVDFQDDADGWFLTDTEMTGRPESGFSAFSSFSEPETKAKNHYGYRGNKAHMNEEILTVLDLIEQSSKTEEIEDENNRDQVIQHIHTSFFDDIYTSVLEYLKVTDRLDEAGDVEFGDLIGENDNDFVILSENRDVLMGHFSSLERDPSEQTIWDQIEVALTMRLIDACSVEKEDESESEMDEFELDSLKSTVREQVDSASRDLLKEAELQAFDPVELENLKMAIFLDLTAKLDSSKNKDKNSKLKKTSTEYRKQFYEKSSKKKKDKYLKNRKSGASSNRHKRCVEGL
uniref:Uncharacterized protein n=1 Tax=Clytia hemisphaerica TaxID=252671 RepID=A0A7M5V070_9CNID